LANQLILGRALDANGYIAPGAKATIYADGTATLISVYSDVAGTIAAANPIVADADGLWPQRYVTEDAKAVVTTSAGVTIYTLDPAPTSQGSGAAASQISFTPSVSPPLPQTNVQDAIIAAANLVVSGFAAFGLGVTGNATLLANLDATGTGAGIYRFDGTTTGTFPTGVAAGDTGAVELWRQTGATAMMELHHATSNRVFRRRMTATTWGAWREVVNVDQATVQGDLVYRGASDFQRLPKGTAGQALVMNSGATAPEWGSESLFFRLNEGVAGANVTSLQNFFPQAVTLEASTVYEYEFWIGATKSAGTTAHTFSVGFGGTHTRNNTFRHLLTSGQNNANRNAAVLTFTGFSSAATDVVVANYTSAIATFWHREVGSFSVNAAGTWFPAYQLSAAPGGAWTTEAGSYVRLRKFGASGANSSQGAWA